MELHGNVVFGGDGYSTDWHKAAVEERGLKNIPTTADALPALNEDYIVKLFESTGVLSPVELASRYEVYSEQYVLSIEVEAKLVVDMGSIKGSRFYFKQNYIIFGGFSKLFHLKQRIGEEDTCL